MHKKTQVQKIKKHGGINSGPYWDWVYNHCPVDSDGEYKEPSTANPDVLSEDNSLWYDRTKDLDEVVETRKQKLLKKILKDTVNNMTGIDREIVTLMSQRFHTLREIAEITGVSKSFIHKRLNEIRRRCGQTLKNGSIGIRDV